VARGFHAAGTGETPLRLASARTGLFEHGGTETWTPRDVGDVAISTLEQRGRRSKVATMVLGGPGSPVRSAVQHLQASGNTTACSNSNQNGDGFFSLPVSGNRSSGAGRASTPPGVQRSRLVAVTYRGDARRR
jgi:hypothetical protein